LTDDELQRNNEIIIECANPNGEIYQFDSTLTLKSHKYSISNSQLLLQGTKLKNTTWVLGCVVYSGNQTKIGMNKQKLEIKWTRSDVFMNRTVAFIFLFQLSMMYSFQEINSKVLCWFNWKYFQVIELFH
jgi:magnesium-transporting ATPase (P-type)